jgi:hypothetical protein
MFINEGPFRSHKPSNGRDDPDSPLTNDRGSCNGEELEYFERSSQLDCEVPSDEGSSYSLYWD